MFKNKKGFTLIELLVVIAIIGLLSTLAVVALTSARQKARDAKRVADMKQVQTAMEMIFNEKSSYALGGCAAAGVALSTCTPPTGLETVVNFAVIKDAKEHATMCASGLGACATAASCEYSVAVVPTATTYKFCFALESKTGELDAGKYEVSPTGFTLVP